MRLPRIPTTSTWPLTICHHPCLVHIRDVRGFCLIFRLAGSRCHRGFYCSCLWSRLSSNNCPIELSIGRVARPASDTATGAASTFFLGLALRHPNQIHSVHGAFPFFSVSVLEPVCEIEPWLRRIVRESCIGRVIAFVSEGFPSASVSIVFEHPLRHVWEP